ncbi:hypothetical protein PLICRDRAFT_113718 [Plicaturopsis crispa FD-325 SS-3]|nr:hypothetical protein PLICRDRAFT_113718 [Plicaturopsis crispa FD-325 SS-3]
MGGKAFQQLGLSLSAFPRLAPAVYLALKARFQPSLSPLFSLVGVPAEAPEKRDHGDIDFIVAGPSEGVGHLQVAQALGAVHRLEFEVTSHYAVDVHVCQDKDEWERVLFFHGYGDLGMMMAALVRPHGMSLGTKGLKISPMPHTLPPFHLSDKPSSILAFLGLALPSAFKTQRAAFEWAATSWLFDPARLEKPKDFSPATQLSQEARGMYQAFLRWATHQPRSSTTCPLPSVDLTADPAIWPNSDVTCPCEFGDSRCVQEGD